MGCIMLKWWFKVKMSKKWNSTTSSQTTACVSACRLVKSLWACQKNLGLGKEAIGFARKSLLSTICSAKNGVLCHVLSIFSGQWWH